MAEPAPSSKSEEDINSYQHPSVEALQLMLGVNFKTWYTENVVPTASHREALTNCEQCSAEWHRARKYTLSGSRAHTALFGHFTQMRKGGQRAVEMSLAKVIENFTNPAPVTSKAVIWGKIKEKYAQQAAEEVIEKFLADEGRAVRTLSFRYPGGIPIRGHPYFIASVDGLADIVYEDGSEETILIELKCPVSQFYSEKYLTGIPPGYYIQILCYMGYLRIHDPATYGAKMHRCLFLQWDRNACHAAVYNFDAELFHTQVVPRLQELYFNHILPRLVLIESAVLPKNSLVLPRTFHHPDSPTPSDEADGPPMKRAKKMSFKRVRVTSV